MHDLTEVTAITGGNRNFTGYVKAVSFLKKVLCSFL